MRNSLFYIGFLSLLASLLTACSQSETVTTYEQEAAKQKVEKAYQTSSSYSPSDVPITFGLSSGATTRALITNESDLLEEGFSVFAYYTGSSTYAEAITAGTAIPNLMYNQKVHGIPQYNTPGNPSSGISAYVEPWTYSPLKYWPNETVTDGNGATSTQARRVTFFAYAPHVPVTQTNASSVSGATAFNAGITSISGNNYSGDPILSYNLGSATVQMGDMKDLLYADSGDEEVTYGSVNPSYNSTISAHGQYIDMVKPMLDTQPIKFQFYHALSGFGFGVCGVFNEVGRGFGTGDDSKYVIDDNTYIKIESIDISASLPTRGTLNLNGGEWQTDGSSQQTVNFHMDASNIAPNLCYIPFGIDETSYLFDEESFLESLDLLTISLTEEEEAEIEASFNDLPLPSAEKIAAIQNAKNEAKQAKAIAAEKARLVAARTAAIAAEKARIWNVGGIANDLLSYGVGRYCEEYDYESSFGNTFDLDDNDKIPHKVIDGKANNIYQKVGRDGSARQNLFYFIPASESGSITFNVTITYHSLTRDSRMLYGIGDVKNVVSGSADLDVSTAKGKLYFINMQLGMTDMKINGVSMGNYYDNTSLDNSTWNQTWSKDKFYYTVPK